MGDGGVPSEIQLVKLQKDYRLAIPRSLVPKVAWLKGNQPLAAWLLLNTLGRCRVVHSSDAERDQEIQALRGRISAGMDQEAESALDFVPGSVAVLPFRLMLVDVRPPEPAWRLEMPKSLAAILQLHPGESEVAMLVVQGYLELWTLDTLKESVAVPLSKVIEA